MSYAVKNKEKERENSSFSLSSCLFIFLRSLVRGLFSNYGKKGLQTAFNCMFVFCVTITKVTVLTHSDLRARSGKSWVSTGFDQECTGDMVHFKGTTERGLFLYEFMTNCCIYMFVHGVLNMAPAIMQGLLRKFCGLFYKIMHTVGADCFVRVLWGSYTQEVTALRISGCALG